MRQDDQSSAHSIPNPEGQEQGQNPIPTDGSRTDANKNADWLPIAKAYLGESRIGGLPTLVRHRGTWLKWDGAAYREVDEEDITADLYAVLNANHTRVGTTAVNNTLGQLKAIAGVSSGVSDPAWIGKGTGDMPNPEECVAFANGVVHIPSAAKAKSPTDVEVIPPSPAFFIRWSVPYEFNPEAPEPTEWLHHLDEVFEGDADRVAMLSQWFGYTLAGGTGLQKILLVVGRPRSGKGVNERVLTEMLGGSGQVGATTAKSFGSRFGREPLIGKRLITMPETIIESATRTRDLETALLQVSGEDSVPVDRKGQKGLTMRLPGRIMITGNQMPAFDDASSALSNRLLLLKHDKTFAGREDHDRESKIRANMPGIINWAIRGYGSLVEQGGFTVPQAAAEELRESVVESTPVLDFLNSWCVVDPEGVVYKQVLFKVWCEYCIERGIDPGSSIQFAKKLHSTGQVENVRLREGSRRPYAYRGIALNMPYQRDDAPAC